MRGRLGDRYKCDDRSRRDFGTERVAESYGCNLPRDEYPEHGGGDACQACKTRVACATPGHGLRYLGKRGFGFRTDRCPKSWAADPIAVDAERAFGWVMMRGGVGAVWLGGDPPAVLMDALELFASETGHRRMFEQKQDDEERKRRARARTGLDRGGPRISTGDPPEDESGSR